MSVRSIDRPQDSQTAPLPGSCPTPITFPESLEKLKAERAMVSRISAAIGRAAMEVLAGSRAAEGLRGLLAAQPLDALSARAELIRRARLAGGGDLLHTSYRSARVGSVHPCCVCPGVYEVSVVIREANRCRALALRLEEQGGTWKVTALLIG